MVLPAPSFTVTSEPAWAVPVIVVPFVGLTAGADGDTALTVVLASGLLLPAASVAATCRTVPWAGGVVGLKLYAPPVVAVVLPMSLPASSVMVTTEPASALPVTRLPLVGSTVGLAGGSLSTVAVAGWLALPAASVATTLIFTPSCSERAGVTAYSPLLPAVALPTRLPVPSLAVTSEPASAVPAMVLPEVGLTVGASGALLSTLAVAGALLLPAASVAVTLSAVSCAGGVAGLTA